MKSQCLGSHVFVVDIAGAASYDDGVTMISYADNREDVLLARVFRDQRQGFYIDVGANHPTSCSVTRHFYDLGWRGINVEPVAALFAMYATERPRDTTLNVALSDAEGQLEFWEGLRNATGLSTSSAAEVERHRRAGFDFARRTVTVTTLARVCERHVGDRTIDFLSVDVEGHERNVLIGADFRRFRPRVVLVEATRPNTQEPTHGAWEQILAAADYRFVFFDGLNRYYVRGEDERALAPAFATPVNVFDDFVSYETWALRQKVRAMPVIGDGALAVARRVDELYRRYPRLASAAGRLLGSWTGARRG